MAIDDFLVKKIVIPLMKKIPSTKKSQLYITSYFLLYVNPTHHRLHKIINRNTVKICYSWMLNMPSHISSHNKNIMQKSKKSQHPNSKTCDCQVAENCLLNRNCKQSAVIYQTDVTQEIDNKRLYIGLTESPLKRDCLIIVLSLSMSNTKINHNYLLLSGKQKPRDRISKSSDR